MQVFTYFIPTYVSIMLQNLVLLPVETYWFWVSVSSAYFSLFKPGVIFF